LSPLCEKCGRFEATLALMTPTGKVTHYCSDCEPPAFQEAGRGFADRVSAHIRAEAKLEPNHDESVKSLVDDVCALAAFLQARNSDAASDTWVGIADRAWPAFLNNHIAGLAITAYQDAHLDELSDRMWAEIHRRGAR
jgi:hypothetical protein